MDFKESALFTLSIVVKDVVAALIGLENHTIRQGGLWVAVSGELDDASSRLIPSNNPNSEDIRLQIRPTNEKTYEPFNFYTTHFHYFKGVTHDGLVLDNSRSEHNFRLEPIGDRSTYRILPPRIDGLAVTLVDGRLTFKHTLRIQMEGTCGSLDL